VTVLVTVGLGLPPRHSRINRRRQFS